ncbi:YybS family protein [Gottfriedia solisilvae]|uniref:Membrane protein n=1 Tax=Gottfriedia solisilvae TaxID=1516104 RepID=A0A8J3F160_9BACI|nr:DUF2232 domain-containing protein [Gottfriedia solisilvae]GGI17062.1 membrane protein [Gottfriedia solisilvae]
MKSTRFITEGAVLLALYSIMLLLITYVPFLSIVLTYLMPLPFIIFSLKYSIKESLLLICVALGLTLVITQASFILGTLMFSTVGIAIGYQLGKERSKGEILLTSTFLYFIHIVLIYLIVQLMFDINISNIATTRMTELLEASKNLSSDLGVSYNEKNAKAITEALKLLPVLVPSIMLMLGFTMAFLTQLLTFPIVRRLSFKTPKFKPFREFRLPLGFMWLYLIITILSYFGSKPNGFFYTAIMNISYVLHILVITQGFAAIFYFSHIRKLSKAVPILILIAGLLINGLMIFVLLIGIISIGIFNRMKK